MRIKRYNSYVNENLLLKDDHLEDELKKMGVEGEELEKQVDLAKKGELGTYLIENGKEFTFGMLNAIFRDAKEAKIGQDTKKALWAALPRAIPMALAPFFPIMAIVGLIFGSTRLFNKITKPIFNNLDPDSKYTDFLKSFIKTVVKIPEGEVEVEDRFTRAFVVEDRLIEALKPEVIDAFTNYLSNKMETEPADKPVPDNYIENELKKYLNDTFDVTPEIPLKEQKYIKLFEKFGSVRFVRFSHTEIPEGELTPTLRRKYQEIDEDTEGVYEWTKKLVENGFPDNKVAIHFMTDDTATREAFRAKLYGQYKYEIELKDANQKIGWTFMWPINEWFYKTNYYLGNGGRMEPKCVEGKEALSMLDSKIGHLKSISYDDLTTEDCGEMAKTLLESGLIGFGTMNDLMSSKLYNKENLFVWTSNTVVVKSY